MYETVDVPVSDLLLDPGNARLGEEQPNQQATYIRLAEQQGPRLVKLARDIVENGLDPTTLPAVVATGDRRRRYRVIEGNRRVLALKALETPSIVSSALEQKDYKALLALSVRYSNDPVDEVTCVLFPTEKDAEHWVDLRHTGANDGAGLVEWSANERDRYKARHGRGGGRSLGGQALDFIARIDQTDTSKARIMTNVDRLLRSSAVREQLGLDKDGNELTSRFPAEEVAKGLRRIVDDLVSTRIRVKNIYDETDRQGYIATFTKDELPNKAKEFKEPVLLTELELGKIPAKPRKRPPKPKPKPAQRTTLVPSTCKLNPQHPRINAIYNELLTLSVDTHPNATAVLLRVFVELSIDHFIDQKGLTAKDSAKLFEKLRLVAQHLFDAGKIPEALRKAIERIAGTKHTIIGASTVTFNQYVHNAYVYPKPSELFAAWDELQPFLEKVWE